MAVACELARLNVENNGGGPFGSIVVDLSSGKIVGYGVNCVLSNGAPFHGEVCAIWDAQSRLGTHDLGRAGLPPFALVTSAAPCAMCAGAIVWSGVRQLVSGARTSDVEGIVGFDEGPIHRDLKSELYKRGINVVEDILRDECCEVLRQYIKSGGVVYNGRSGEE